MHLVLLNLSLRVEGEDCHWYFPKRRWKLLGGCSSNSSWCFGRKLLCVRGTTRGGSAACVRECTRLQKHRSKTINSAASDEPT